MSLIVAILTAISMSAIATNGVVKGGGCYYLASTRPEFGGSIGLIFYFANTVNASMNCVGLAEAIVYTLREYDFELIDGGVNDCIIFIGTQFESKTQVFLLICLIISLAAHIIGTFLPPTEFQSDRGITGSTLQANLFPDFRNGETFITVFGIYFPAMTGIMAGTSMSGDLKDPSKSIPKGTILAIIITTVIYTLAMVLPTVTAVRDATGKAAPIFSNVTHYFIPPSCAANQTCILYGPLVIMGIYASTLSSASGCLIGAPRVFQALCGDNIYPYLKFFHKGRGNNNDPFRAYFLTFFIAISIILIGDLNIISMIITNFFLAAFAITNFACFDATQAKSPGFRPGFRFYNKWLSLFGSVLCIIIMFVLSWMIALLTFGIFVLLFIYIRTKKSNINWGSSTQANSYRNALLALLKLSQIQEHVKNYRPQLLVLTGNPFARQALVDFAYSISKGQNLMICGHVVPYPPSVAATACIKKLNVELTQWLNDHRIRAFYCAVANRSLKSGVQSLLQTVGLGKMQPNILLMGFKTTWLSKLETAPDEVKDYIGVITDAFESDMSICVFRNGNEGLDHSVNLISSQDNFILKLPDLMLSDTKSSLSDDLNRGAPIRAHRPTTPIALSIAHLRASRSAENLRHSSSISSALSLRKEFGSKGLTQRRTKFGIKVKDGIIDVWWLFDDGGLTLLIPYLLADHASYLQGAQLRIFTITHNSATVDEEREKLENLLKRFRINFSEVQVLCDEDEKPLYPETEAEYAEFLKVLQPKVPENIFRMSEARTQRMMRSRELLLEYSSHSSLVVVQHQQATLKYCSTMPVAKKAILSSPIYLMWLEFLTKDLPPTLLVRGNQITVLTFYF
uniref:Solute carrier family 12 member 9 n=1 Tax=Syphacia muris TaxID=451379 RepID=A0A0N5ANZ6_9BILA